MRFRPLILFFLIAFGLSLGCAYYNTFYNAKKFYNAASAERKKRMRTQVVELSPEEKEQLKRQGITSSSDANRPSSQEMQSYQQAIEKASSLLEFYPKSKYVDDALMLLGESFFHRREFSKALRKFQELSELYPDSKFVPEARLLMAKTYLGLQEFDEAERQFRELSLDTKLKKSIREEAEYELAGLYYEKGNYELAAQEYSKAVRASVDKLMRAMSLYRLGECLIILKEYQEAPKILRQAVKESPNEDFKAQATFKLGQAQSLVKDYDAAVRTFADLLSKEFEVKRIPLIKLELANNLRAKRDLTGALKWYQNLIEEHKRTDASARAYFALGDIEEFVRGDYKKAKEDYDLVRGEFANSLIAPEAKRRSDNIAALQELKNGIAQLEGRATESDSTAAGKGGKNGQQAQELEKDDAPIDLSLDAMWVNYAGRDRPPPTTLQNMTAADLQRAAVVRERQLQAGAAADSTVGTAAGLAKAPLDSAALAKEAEKNKQLKLVQLAQKQLSLAELLLFNFNKPDSAIEYYLKVIEGNVDSSMSARALYSLGYVFRSLKQDSSLADSIFKKLLNMYPKTAQAEGARRIVGLPITNDKVDSAQLLFLKAEEAYWEKKDHRQALDLYKAACQCSPKSPYAKKAEYAIGWLYENALHDNEQALAQYKQIVEEDPESFYAKELKTRLAAFDRAKKQEEDRQKAIADSLAKLASAPAQAAKDSSAAAVAGDSTKAVDGSNPATVPGASPPGIISQATGDSAKTTNAGVKGDSLKAEKKTTAQEKSENKKEPIEGSNLDEKKLPEPATAKASPDST